MKPAPPHFPIGSAVRVCLRGRIVDHRRRVLDGRVGVVVVCYARSVLVDFPAERVQFSPHHLEPAETPAPEKGRRK